MLLATVQYQKDTLGIQFITSIQLQAPGAAGPLKELYISHTFLMFSRLPNKPADLANFTKSPSGNSIPLQIACLCCVSVIQNSPKAYGNCLLGHWLKQCSSSLACCKESLLMGLNTNTCQVVHVLKYCTMGWVGTV